MNDPLPGQTGDILRLKAEIAACRRSLEDLWNAKGHTDNEVLTISAKLDQLVNMYQRLSIKYYSGDYLR